MDTLVRVSSERFAAGITLAQFRDSMTKNQDVWQENYSGFGLEPRDTAFFQGIPEALNVLVLAEDWCGDVLRYLPAFARIAEAVPHWNVRVFLRDDNPDLADLWLKDGAHRAIPVIVFFDQGMKEIACFVERPAAVYATEARARERFAQEHPELADAGRPVGEMSDLTREIYATYIRQFRADNKPKWQQWFVDELKEKLQEAKSTQTVAA